MRGGRGKLVEGRAGGVEEGEVEVLYIMMLESAAADGWSSGVGRHNRRHLREEHRETTCHS